MFVKYKSYPISRFGQPIAFVVVKVNPFNLKLKAEITLNNGQSCDLVNQWASEEQFDLVIENFIRIKNDMEKNNSKTSFLRLGVAMNK